MKNFGFYVSGNASRLKKYIQYLHDKQEHEIISKIKVVITDNVTDLEIRELTERNNIQCDYFDPSSVDKYEVNLALSDYILQRFEHFNVSFGFVFGARILKGSLLDKYRDRLINFHPSVLPAYKGRNAIDRALEDKAFLLGNTAHLIVEEVDAGPIIMQHLAHRSQFVDYEHMLDHQLIMLHHIMYWINNDRLEIVDGTVRIVDAIYKTAEFIPNIEL